MPVLATIATVTILFTRSSGGKAGFLDPAALRSRLEKKLPKGAMRDQALSITDDIETLARRYDAAAEASLATYIDDVKNWTSTADVLIADLAPLDSSRAHTLTALIELRTRLRDVLTPAQWKKVFG